ncbi:type 2 periplasmic-binding domain-containing protein [Algiphilus aromaticivorans]|uniref:hypothetical protein n=1 Tax=Algiphilus aromaticivorans TaxID=382454 RepID=UPI0005C1E8B7|nr:hypothetical protein [Algiphilus aromaticivorans]
MTADITRTWAGVAEANDRIGYNGELLTPAEISRREAELADGKLLGSARELFVNMDEEARQRRIATLREKWGDARTDKYLARLRQRLRSETEAADA